MDPTAITTWSPVSRRAPTTTIWPQVSRRAPVKETPAQGSSPPQPKQVAPVLRAVEPSRPDPQPARLVCARPFADGDEEAAVDRPGAVFPPPFFPVPEVQAVDGDERFSLGLFSCKPGELCAGLNNNTPFTGRLSDHDDERSSLTSDDDDAHLGDDGLRDIPIMRAVTRSVAAHPRVSFEHEYTLQRLVAALFGKDVKDCILFNRPWPLDMPVSVLFPGRATAPLSTPAIKHNTIEVYAPASCSMKCLHLDVNTALVGRYHCNSGKSLITGSLQQFEEIVDARALDPLCGRFNTYCSDDVDRGWRKVQIQAEFSHAAVVDGFEQKFWDPGLLIAAKSIVASRYCVHNYPAYLHCLVITWSTQHKCSGTDRIAPDAICRLGIVYTVWLEFEDLACAQLLFSVKLLVC